MKNLPRRKGQDDQGEHSNPQPHISSQLKGSREQEDTGTRRPGTQDYQGEQEERNNNPQNALKPPAPHYLIAQRK